MFPALHDLSRDIRAMPRAVWVLVSGQFVNRLGGFVYPFLTLFLTQRGLSLGQISLVLGGLALGQLAAPFAGGYLADAYGRRNTIVLSLVGGALTLLGLFVGEVLPALIGLACAHGFFANMFNPAANALLSDLVTPQQRVTAFALLRLAINAGFSAGPALAGLLFGIAPVLIFLGDAGTTLIFALLALLLLPQGLRTVSGNIASPAVIARSWWEVAQDAWRNGPFMQLYVGMLLTAIGFIQVFTLLALHATARGLDTFAYGIAMGFNGLLILCLELPLARAVQRFRARRVLIAGFTITGVGCAAFTFADSLPGFLVAMAIFTFGEMISLPIAAGYASELAPTAFRGRYFGLFGTVWGFAGLCGSVGPWLYGQLGATWWAVAGTGGVVAGAGMLLQWRDRRPVPPIAAAALALR